MPFSIRFPLLNCWRIIFAGLVLALLGACSTTRLAYTNGHELAWWWLSDYIDVQGEDRTTLRRAVHQVHDWHRREQLAATVDLLQRWQPQFAGDLPAESACRLVDEVMQRAIELSGLVQALDASALQLRRCLAPLAGAMIAGFLGRWVGRRGAHLATILGVAVAFVLSAITLLA